MAELDNITTKGLSESSPISDSELLALFRSESESAWRIFLDRYADFIFVVLRSLGFDYDQAMDRFVYVCEKLSEKNYHRLKSVRYAGRYGELKPWLRQVVNRLSINWAWSEDGRRRLLKPIKKMSAREQRVFELYFWQGLSPVAIEERLRLEHFDAVTLSLVFEALNRIHSALSEKKLWRLVSNLARTRGVVSLEAMDEESAGWDPPDEKPDPETDLIAREQDQLLQKALKNLPEQQVLIMQLRFEQALSVGEIADILRLDEREVRKTLNTGLEHVRRSLKGNK